MYTPTRLLKGTVFQNFGDFDLVSSALERCPSRLQLVIESSCHETQTELTLALVWTDLAWSPRAGAPRGAPIGWQSGAVLPSTLSCFAGYLSLFYSLSP